MGKEQSFQHDAGPNGYRWVSLNPYFISDTALIQSPLRLLHRSQNYKFVEENRKKVFMILTKAKNALVGTQESIIHKGK